MKKSKIVASVGIIAVFLVLLYMSIKSLDYLLCYPCLEQRLNYYYFEQGVMRRTALGFCVVALFLLAAFASVMLYLRLSKTEHKKMTKLRHDFISNVSHELKTPITVIRGSLEALCDGVVTEPERVLEYYEQMLKETTALEGLVTDLLELTRLQDSKFIINKSQISLCECLDDVLRSMKTIADKKGIVFNVQKNKPKCNIYADYGRIRQMLLAVLDNAVKFSSENSVIDISFNENVLSIRDYGIGIDKKDLAYIFDRFYRGSKSKNKAGTGLGLSIAKEIADRHNVKLYAESKNGTEVFFSF